MGAEPPNGVCPHCQQPVVFAVSARTGQPLSLDPLPRPAGAEGTHQVCNTPEAGHQRARDGLWTVVALTPAQRATKNQANLYQPHRDTCPKRRYWDDGRRRGA